MAAPMVVAVPTGMAVDPSESTMVTAVLSSLTPKTAKGDTRLKGICVSYLNLVDVMLSPPCQTPNPPMA